MLVDLNSEIYKLKIELLSLSNFDTPEGLILKADLDQKLSLKIWMVLGEGAVFITILLFGFRAVKKSIDKELSLAVQQKNFLLSVTHELKSPLASIKLQLQTLKSRKLDSEKVEHIQGMALRDADRLEKLVENLLLVNKVESGNLPLQKKELEISDFVRQTIASNYSIQLDAGQVKIGQLNEATVSVDPLATESILFNLIDNALKYGGGQPVEVALVRSESKPYINLTVSDHGTGITDAEKKKIFDRFYRVGNEEVRKTKGTGVGLYIVKLLTEQHGGEITVGDNSPNGSVFSVTLPTI